MVLLQLSMAKDPEAAFFKRLEGLQPCEVLELNAGTHIFAVYGLNTSPSTPCLQEPIRVYYNLLITI